MQEYLALPAGRVFPLPSSLPLQEGTLVEPLAVACHAVRQAEMREGGQALVLGAGAIGLLIAQAWRAIKGSPIAITDVDEKRLDVAAALDIPIYRQPKDIHPINVLFEATGSAQAFSDWLPTLGVEGRAVVIGKVANSATVDWVSLMRKEASIRTSRHFTLPDFEQALRLLASGQVQAQSLIGGVTTFGSLVTQDGRTVMGKARQHIRILVRLHDPGLNL
jgi:2-desacetyl-2-hydroxyethyl bacteriochlorophyllide A dehydrogenase